MQTQVPSIHSVALTSGPGSHSGWHRLLGTQEMLGKQSLNLLVHDTGSWNAGECVCVCGVSLSLSGSTLEQIHSPEFSESNSPIRQDALCDLTHQDEEQHEGQDPA